MLAPFLAFDFALVGTNATHVTEASLVLIMLSRVTFDFIHLSILFLKYFTSFLSSLFFFKRLVSQDIEVEQASNCEEYGIDNKSSYKVDTYFLPTSQGLAIFSIDPLTHVMSSH